MYHTSGSTQLRVVHRLTSDAANRPQLGNTRVVLLEHILPTTAELVRLLDEAGVSISSIIAKPYSVDTASAELLGSRFKLIIKKNYREIEQSGILTSVIERAIKESQKDGKQIVIIDVGGYFAAPMARLKVAQTKNIVGVIEDTTFGHNRYKKVCRSIRVPVVSVARSELKEIEARFVGRDAVVAMESLLRKAGISITGRNALVIGYGMIGKNVARTLDGYDLNVYVYDKEDRQLLRAFNDGFHIHKKSVLLRHADIVFSATGSEAIHGCSAMSLEDIEDCKHGVILASVGSRDTEFNIEALRNHAAAPENVIQGESRLQRFRMPNSKDVIVAMDGTAVNFYLPTLAIEILDLVFSEIVTGMLALLKREWSWEEDGKRRVERIRTGSINQTPSHCLDDISKQWLRSVNMEAQA